MHSAIAERARAVRAESPQGAKLRVVPILGPTHDQPRYEVLRPETLEKVLITEISAAGSVPTLMVRNQLDVCVFLMDGQELVGAKQNRILNTDVLVPALTSLKIPVSCVEQGRWHQTTQHFYAGNAASIRVRSGKQRRVHESLRDSAKFDAAQAQVWDEVQMSLAASKVANSRTGALADGYASRDREMNQMRSELTVPDNTVGVAVFHGNAFMGLDLFDRHSTLKRFWDRLIDSYAIDLMDAPIEIEKPKETSEQVEIHSILATAAAAEWERFASPGEGTDWRLASDNLNGSALLWEDRVVLHLQLFPNREMQSPAYPRPGRTRGAGLSQSSR